MFFPSIPFSYAVEITFACNNACSGCANAWTSHHEQSLQNWKDLLDRIAPVENRRKYAELIRITGGEPTLHKAFRQIIEYLDTFGIPHAIFSCGRWEHPDEIINIYQECENFIGMLISLHGSTKFAHNAFVQSADRAFDETCENIRRASSSGIDVFTNTVLTKFSCEQIEEIIGLSRELGAGYAVFNRFLGSPHPLDPAENQLREAILLIEKLRNKGVPCRIGNCVPKCFAENSSEGANGGIEHCAVSPKGWVRPNNLTDYVFGNIFEQSVEEIWGSERAQWYRSQIPQACFECAELSRCRGGEKSVTIKHGFGKDHLMKTPIREASPETVILDPELKPIPYFNVREEHFGYLVVRYNWSVPVSHSAKAILDAINGENSLADLQREFGEEALNFVGHLYREKCIGFE
ncbi:radical SAM protein [Desulfobacterales bacterium HSG2]|nr:radical SAM protein [Desulfobacterales bacterium HSG2]